MNATTSGPELFGILREMVEPLRDAHLSLEAPTLGLSFRGARGTLLSNEQYQAHAKVIWSEYVRGALKSYCHDKIWYGKLDDGVGYLLITTFIDFKRGGDFEAQRQALSAALDAIFAESSELNGLVIDLRYNTGGYNGLGVMLASRLTKQRYIAYSVEARITAAESLRFTPPQQVWVEPSAAPGFSGNAVVLTGPNCISACETFTVALLGRRPSVTLVGEPTQGVFSEVAERVLPNGWRLGLPTEVFLSEDGRSFDIIGVPPNVLQPVFRAEDVARGRDPSIEKALQILR